MLTKRINKRRYSRVRLPGCPAASSAPPRRDFSPIDRAAEPTMLSFAIESTYLCRGIARILCTSSTTRAVFYGLTLSDKVYLVIFSVSFRDRLPVIRARWGSPWKEKLFNDQLKSLHNRMWDEFLPTCPCPMINWLFRILADESPWGSERLCVDPLPESKARFPDACNGISIGRYFHSPRMIFWRIKAAATARKIFLLSILMKEYAILNL